MANVINLEEEIGKWVGRRTPPTDPFVAYDRLLRLGGQIRRATAYPKGVFRFRTHEEADAWRWKHTIQAATTR